MFFRALYELTLDDTVYPHVSWFFLFTWLPVAPTYEIWLHREVSVPFLSRMQP